MKPEDVERLKTLHQEISVGTRGVMSEDSSTCRSCGQDTVPDARACPHCGAPYGWASHAEQPGGRAAGAGCACWLKALLLLSLFLLAGWLLFALGKR